MAKQENWIEYEIITGEGRGSKEEYRIEIPENWKVTYGKLHGGDSRSGGMGDGCVLRIYESDTKQRAIFKNVISFRALTIPTKRKIVDTKILKNAEYDSQGNKVADEKIDVEERWEELK